MVPAVSLYVFDNTYFIGTEGFSRIENGVLCSSIAP